MVDPTGFTVEQWGELREGIALGRGWLHPDGVRWIIPVEAPKTTKERWVRKGLPDKAIEVAH